MRLSPTAHSLTNQMDRNRIESLHLDFSGRMVGQMTLPVTQSGRSQILKERKEGEKEDREGGASRSQRCSPIGRVLVQ